MIWWGICLSIHHINCLFPSRYLRLVTGYHNILLRAFCGMHDAGHAPMVTGDEMAEELSLVHLVDGLESVADPGEDMYRKALRIKSTKTYEWLLCEATTYHLLICTLTNQALERIMFTFMQRQRDDTWLIPNKSPVVVMSNPSTSPASSAINALFGLMNLGHCNDGCFPLPAIQGESQLFGFRFRLVSIGLSVSSFHQFQIFTSSFQCSV